MKKEQKEGTAADYNLQPIVIPSASLAQSPLLAVRCFQIDFGNHIRCQIKVTNNQIEVEAAMNGWGDSMPLNEVVIVELQ